MSMKLPHLVMSKKEPYQRPFKKYATCIGGVELAKTMKKCHGREI